MINGNTWAAIDINAWIYEQEVNNDGKCPFCEIKLRDLPSQANLWPHWKGECLNKLEIQMVKSEDGKLHLEKHECHELTKMVTEGLRPNIDNQVRFRVSATVESEVGRIKEELVKHVSVLAGLLIVVNLLFWWIFK